MLGPRPWPNRPPTHKRWGFPLLLTLRPDPGAVWTLSPRPGRVVAVVGSPYLDTSQSSR